MTPTMQTILILDDDHEHHKVFASRWKGFVRTHVYDVKAALQAISGDRYQIMQLDYDLGRGEDNNGLYFVKQLIELPSWMHPDIVIVHTSLEHQGKLMRDVLRSVSIDSEFEPYRAGD